MSTLRRFTVGMMVLALSATACGGDDSGTGGSGGSGGAGGAGGAGGSGAAGGGGSGGEGGQELPPATQDWGRDLLSTGLELDLTTHAGKASIEIAASDTSLGASFEVGDLTINSVTLGGSALNYEVADKQLNVGVPTGDLPGPIVVDYTFADHTQFDGWMAEPKLTFLWPQFCGNLFPCKSDPTDGLKFTMAVTGVPDGLTAVFPAEIPSDAPSYMPAIAAADFTKLELAPTTAGTKVSVWYLPGQDVEAASGTAHLSQVFDFYEKTYGPYSFGPEAGSVSADWGGGDYGGMEHHPFWHVSSGSLYSEEVNAHEAAHGWYGDGVRIACWEDFVLSEGTVTYMAAHALEQLGVDVWPDYECQLKYSCDPATGQNTIALPDTCGAIDIISDPLWSVVPYMKGAYFLRNVAGLLGEATVDEALSEFYMAHVGKAARMQDLIDHLKTKGSAAEIDTLAQDWLRTLDCPVDIASLCP